jgi:hypothetical protein
VWPSSHYVFIRESLFDGPPVDLEDPVLLLNLSEPEVGKLLFDSFKTAINSLTIQEAGTTRIEDRIRLRDTRPFRTDRRPYLAATKSVFNKTVGEPNSGGFELSFAAFLEGTSRHSRNTTWLLASGLTTSRPMATCPITRRTSSSARRTARCGSWRLKGERDRRPAEDAALAPVVRGCYRRRRIR